MCTRACGALRVGLGQVGGGVDIHPRQQLLYIAAADPFGLELFWADLAVQQRDGHQIFEVVVRLLFGRRWSLSP